MEFTLSGLELPVRIRPDRPLSDDELLRFCAANDVLRIECEPNGELTVTSPTGAEAGEADAEITYQLSAWARVANSGTVFSSSAGFRLPDGSMRSPDCAYITWPVWNAVTREQRRGFAPLCPEFIIELRSPSDRLKGLQAKMWEWVANGARLAWLVDPERKTVEVYRPGATPATVTGDANAAARQVGQALRERYIMQVLWSEA